MNEVTVNVLAPAMQRAGYEALLRQMNGTSVVPEAARVTLLAGRDWFDRLAGLGAEGGPPPGTILIAEDASLDLNLGAQAGVRVFITSDDSPDCLVEAVRAAAAGRVFYSESLLPLVHGAFHGGSAGAGPASRPRPSLTAREREVLEALLPGRTNEEIALVLHISVTTVKFHVQNLKRKCGVRSRRDFPTAVHRFRLLE